MIGCQLTGNDGGDGYGGAVFSFNSSPTLTLCTIASNESWFEGGGVYAGYNSELSLTSCSITVPA